MSSMDLYEDGFPHSTREGYERGCRGSACPGKVEVGLSCAEAHARWHGDYRFNQRVNAGMSPAEIMAAEAEERAQEAAAAKAAAPAPRKVPVAAEPVVAPVPVVEKAPRARLVEPEQPAKPKRGPGRVRVTEIHHGTAYGYQRGCRDKETCPAPDGTSCWQAYRDYQNDYTARRRENQEPLGSIAGLPKGTRKAPRGADSRDARIRELEALLASVQAPGSGRHRAGVA